MTEKTDLMVVVDKSPFANKESFEHAQRVALMLSKSELVPAKYKNKPENCLIAMEMANRMGASILMVMQNLDVILGKPAWSSKFLIATINSCGKFSPLRYEEDDKNGGRTRAWAIDNKTGEKLYGEWVTMEMAKAEGWIDKAGSKWKTMPGLMRRYRAASFFVNQFAPEISMGFQTVDEVYDIAPAAATAENINGQADKLNKEKERILLMIGDCTSLQKLELLLTHCSTDEELLKAYKEKYVSLKISDCDTIEKLKEFSDQCETEELQGQYEMKKVNLESSKKK